MPPHPLTNFEIKKNYQYENTFKGVYSRDNLPKIKDGTYIINLDEYSDIGTHWIAFQVQNIDLLILIVLEQNILKKRLEHLSVIKT